MRCIYMLVFSPTQNTSYTSSPTNSRVETFRLGSRTRAINATHNPIPRAEKQKKPKPIIICIFLTILLLP